MTARDDQIEAALSSPSRMSLHAEDCKLRLAVMCTTPVECDHGYDVCPECDPCTCSRPPR